MYADSESGPVCVCVCYTLVPLPYLGTHPWLTTSWLSQFSRSEGTQLSSLTSGITEARGFQPRLPTGEEILLPCYICEHHYMHLHWEACVTVCI